MNRIDSVTKSSRRPLIPFLSLLDNGGKIAICRIESATYQNDGKVMVGRIVLSLIKPLYGKTPSVFTVKYSNLSSQAEPSSDYFVDRWSCGVPRTGDLWLLFLERENSDSIVLPSDSSRNDAEPLQVFDARNMREAETAHAVQTILSLYQNRGSKTELQKLSDATLSFDVDVEIYVGELIVKHLVQENKLAAEQLQTTLISVIQEQKREHY